MLLQNDTSWASATFLLAQETNSLSATSLPILSENHQDGSGFIHSRVRWSDWAVQECDTQRVMGMPAGREE